jgi:putative membrane protein
MINGKLALVGWSLMVGGGLVFADAAFDAETLAKVHQINITEIAAGKLARTQGGTRRVQEYGRMLTEEHSSADDKLSNLSRSAGIVLPDLSATADGKTMLEKNRQMIDRLAATKGKDFDPDFITSMATGHTEAIALVKDAKDKVVNAEVKKYLSELEPSLEAHLRVAQKLEKRPVSE